MTPISFSSHIDETKPLLTDESPDGLRFYSVPTLPTNYFKRIACVVGRANKALQVVLEEAYFHAKHRHFISHPQPRLHVYYSLLLT